jgi:hypothetical protein
MDPAQPRRAHPQIARDLAVRRATSLTKWAVVGALALTGALAGFVSQSKPGHTVASNQPAAGSSKTSGAASAARSAGSPDNATGGGGGATLSPPPAAPAPTPSPPTVVSGGS